MAESLKSGIFREWEVFALFSGGFCGRFFFAFMKGSAISEMRYIPVWRGMRRIPAGDPAFSGVCGQGALFRRCLRIAERGRAGGGRFGLCRQAGCRKRIVLQCFAAECLPFGRDRDGRGRYAQGFRGTGLSGCADDAG